jgi:carboxymethylenebutenolidase
MRDKFEEKSMKALILFGLTIALISIAGCLEMEKTALSAVENESLEIPSGGQNYPAYLAAPAGGGRWPAIVLIHSFNGLEPGYKTMADQLAGEGFVVIAPEWQTFNRTPVDAVVGQLISDSVAHLKDRDDVDSERLGLTGFCAGGRYTMLFLPQMQEFKSGVAWYGFPYSGGFNNETLPANLVSQLEAPMLIIHGTRDQASPVEDIFRYAMALDKSNKYFEMKIYQGEPHGFMIEDGQLSQSFPAQDAFVQMASFFNRTL